MILLNILLFVVLTLLLVAALVMGISTVIGVPFLPTHRRQAKLMMELAGVGEGSRVIDLGSGAGRLLFLAMAKGAHTTGYELNPFLVWWTRFLTRVKKMVGRPGQTQVRWQSLYNADVSQADVVFAFLFPEPMKKLSPKLFAEMKPGSRIVSYAFLIPDKTPTRVEQGIFVYTVDTPAP